MWKQPTLPEFNAELVEQEKLFLGKKISVLFDGLFGKESWTGICERIDVLGYQIVILPKQSKYDTLFIYHESIISILRYNEKTNPVY